MTAVAIADWTNYLSVQAGAAATLTGLVFVAVSINLTRILSIPGLTGRAADSLIQLFGALILSTSALIPRQPINALAVEILVFAALLWVVQTTLQVRYIRSKTGHPLRWALSRIVQTQFATVPFFCAGFLLLRGSAAGLYWLAPGFAFSLISGVTGAWILLIEILR